MDRSIAYHEYCVPSYNPLSPPGWREVRVTTEIRIIEFLAASRDPEKIHVPRQQGDRRYRILPEFLIKRTNIPIRVETGRVARRNKEFPQESAAGPIE